jgi:2-amino-4,5-dihydroxy-6-oxo-7-(phosphonooxy)heptanoate synthase
MPLLAMIYPRGPRIADPHDPVLLAHAVNVAADLGADLVKTSFTLPPQRMSQVVDSSPVPVLAAGGPPDGSDLLGHAASLMLAGCRGLAIGRRIFSSPSPAWLTARLAAVVHAADNGPATHHPTIATGAA